MTRMNLHSISTTIENHFCTPISAIHAINTTPCFLLESADHTKTIGQYSLIGLNPIATVIGRPNELHININNTSSILIGNPLNTLSEWIAQLTHQHTGDTLPIQNGCFGYFAWDCITCIENIPIKSSQNDIFHFSFHKHCSFLITSIKLSAAVHRRSTNHQI